MIIPGKVKGRLKTPRDRDRQSSCFWKSPSSLKTHSPKSGPFPCSKSSRGPHYHLITFSLVRPQLLPSPECILRSSQARLLLRRACSFVLSTPGLYPRGLLDAEQGVCNPAAPQNHLGESHKYGQLGLTLQGSGLNCLEWAWTEFSKSSPGDSEVECDRSRTFSLVGAQTAKTIHSPGPMGNATSYVAPAVATPHRAPRLRAPRGCVSPGP